MPSDGPEPPPAPAFPAPPSVVELEPFVLPTEFEPFALPSADAEVPTAPKFPAPPIEAELEPFAWPSADAPPEESPNELELLVLTSEPLRYNPCLEG